MEGGYQEGEMFIPSQMIENKHLTCLMSRSDWA